MDVLLIGIAALALILAIGMGLILFKVLNDERQRSDARVAALAAAASTVDLPLASQTRRPHASRSRRLPQRPVRHGRRGLALAADAPRVAAVLAVAVANRRLRDHDHGARCTLPAAAPVAPLELLSLKHTQEGNTLTVSGSVRNPRARRAAGSGVRHRGSLRSRTVIS